MKPLTMALITATGLALSLPAHSDLDNRICFEIPGNDQGVVETFGDFLITYNKGEVSSVVGQTCYTLIGSQTEECFASSGNAQFSNGKLEVNIIGSNKVTVAGGSEIFRFLQGYLELDPDTLRGTASMLTTKVVDGAITTKLRTYGDAGAVHCPKPTPQDKLNVKEKNKLIRKMDSL